MVRLEFTLVGIVRSVMTKINEAILHKIFVAQKPITFRWWEECHAPFYP